MCFDVAFSGAPRGADFQVRAGESRSQVSSQEISFVVRRSNPFSRPRVPQLFLALVPLEEKWQILCTRALYSMKLHIK